MVAAAFPYLIGNRDENVIPMLEGSKPWPLASTKEEKEMKKLSAGDDSTLGSYRKLASAFFGEDSKAVEFLDKKITDQGEDQEVIQDESQMVYLLSHMALK